MKPLHIVFCLTPSCFKIMKLEILEMIQKALHRNELVDRRFMASKPNEVAHELNHGIQCLHWVNLNMFGITLFFVVCSEYRFFLWMRYQIILYISCLTNDGDRLHHSNIPNHLLSLKLKLSFLLSPHSLHKFVLTKVWPRHDKFKRK